MNKSTRIRLIQQIRDAMNSMPWDDTDLILEVYGFGAMPEGPDGFTLVQWLQNGSDAELLALGHTLDVTAAAGVADEAPEPLPPQALSIFASHLSTHRAFLGDVETAMKAYGVQLFVAHDSIPIDAEWEPEIASALQTCHAGAAFLHQGFHDSYYCMQEIGWLLGRAVPIARLIFTEPPKGLLGSRQGINVRAMDAEAVAAAIVDYALTKSELFPMLGTSLVRAMGSSTHFKQTDRVWTRLRTISELTEAQCEVLIEAAERNSQVYSAGVGGWSGPPYRRAIADYLDKQLDAAALTERIQAIRKQAL
jgi:hypothetical protein